MTMTLLPKPKPQRQSIRTTVPKPVKVSRSKLNREELEPLLGQRLLLRSIVQRVSRRNNRSFVCLEDVEYFALDQVRLPYKDRKGGKLHHAWCETTDESALPVASVPVNCFVEVIAYERRDGTKAYGFRLQPGLSDARLIGLVSEHCIDVYEEGSYPGSFSAVISKEFDVAIKQLRRGTYSLDEMQLPIIYCELGAQYFINLIQRYQRKMFKYLRRGCDEVAIKYLEAMQSFLQQSRENFEEQTFDDLLT